MVVSQINGRSILVQLRQLTLSVWGQHILGSNPVPDSHLDFKQTPLKIQACKDTDFIYFVQV